MIANAKGELIYMNNPMYALLEMQSDDYLNAEHRQIQQSATEVQ